MSLFSVYVSVPLGLSEVLAHEMSRILALPLSALEIERTGVRVRTDALGIMRLNLHSRLGQRVLIELQQSPYRSEDDVYAAAASVPWEDWFDVKRSMRIDVTAHRCPLKSIHFAALRVKDAVADRFRQHTGERPNVDTHRPSVRIHLHLEESHLQLSIDTSGEPLFKRGWREDKGDAPLKENLAAALLALSGWSEAWAPGPSTETAAPAGVTQGLPLFDPCCGSGTIAIEAAQVACGMAPGLNRRFGFEALQPFEAKAWMNLRQAAQAAIHPPQAPVFGSDVAFRMVDFAERNAHRAGVAHAVRFRGGDALERQAPSEQGGWLLLNPPYGERIEAAGAAGSGRLTRMARHRPTTPHAAPQMAPAPLAREHAQVADGEDFMARLASHWKHHFAGWQAWVLSPDLELPGRMRMKASRRTPVWNGPIECRLFRFELVAGAHRRNPSAT